jgi:hypothetical protein
LYFSNWLVLKSADADPGTRAAGSVGGAVRERDPRQLPEPTKRARSVRARLVRILALPMVAVFALLAVLASAELRDYRTAQTGRGSVDLALSVQNLIQELQEERGLTVGLLAGNAAFRDGIEPERRRVDSARAAVDRRAGQGAHGAVAGAVAGAAAARAALRQLDDIETIRIDADSGKADHAGTFRYFTIGIAALRGVDFGLDRSPDSTLRAGAAAHDALGDAKEYAAQKRAFLYGVFSAGGFARGEFVQYAAMNAAQQAALEQFARYATPAQRAASDAVWHTGAAGEAAYFDGIALEAADGRPVRVDTQSWWSALTSVLDDTRDVQQSIGTDLQRRAALLRAGAVRRLEILLGVALVCLLGSVWLVVAAARSITRPLAALAREADRLASVQLPEAVARVLAGSDDEPAASALPPEPVRVPTRASTEMRSVAGALDRLGTTAYALAAEQALLRRNISESLASLGRRSQNLVRRQLGFISRLERERSDPAGLADLFEVDHLATRMRRNAESLLVLAGEATPRQWAAAPVPIVDVLRAAVAEVEQYRRVTLRRVDEVYVDGGSVGPLAHLIAELIENALTSSPPDLDVDIQGRQLNGQYLIAIVDQGVGMSAEELAQATARLRGDENFLRAPARYLGHYVVGRLAHQLGVDVQLVPSPVTGVTARVMLPAGLLARAPAIAPTDIDPPGRITAHVVSGTLGPADARDPADGADGPVGGRFLGRRHSLLRPEVARAAQPVPAPAAEPVQSAPSNQEAQAARSAQAAQAAQSLVQAAVQSAVQRAIGVRAAPVVEYITVGSSEPEPEPDQPTEAATADPRARLDSLRAGASRSESGRARPVDETGTFLDHVADTDREP